MEYAYGYGTDTEEKTGVGEIRFTYAVECMWYTDWHSGIYSIYCIWKNKVGQFLGYDFIRLEYFTTARDSIPYKFLSV